MSKTVVIDCSLYKIGLRGLSYVKINDEWVRSTRPVAEVEKAIERKYERNGFGRPSLDAIFDKYNQEQL